MLLFAAAAVVTWGCGGAPNPAGDANATASVPAAEIVPATETVSQPAPSDAAPSTGVTQPIAGDDRQPVESVPPATEIERAVAERRAARAELDKTLWQKEILAGRHGQFFVDLWDRLHEAKDPFAVIRDFKLPQLVLPAAVSPRPLSLEVEEFRFGVPTETLTESDWVSLLSRWQQAGYRLAQSEWHHRQFAIGEDGRATSRVEMVLHIENPQREERLIVSSDLHVRWLPLEEGQRAAIEVLEAAELQIWRRTGLPPFRLAAALPVESDTATDAADFLGLYDLDGDGDAEILFGNRLFRNQGGGKFSAEPISPHRKQGLSAAVLADFSGDGRVDLLCADSGIPPQLFLADAQGRFSTPPKAVAIPPLTLAQAVTAGDVNGDGHLDVWLTQYKGPYDSGQMPTPYYDANDGYPSYLLLGNGKGEFTDATESAGLAAKRFRRTYSTSLVDLDDDTDLDLLVVSDFAGVDVYANQGNGTFQDVSEKWLDTRHNFGMSHTFGDFNGDGRLDMYVTGMASTTARRLEQLGIRHPDFDEHNKMRPLMGYGNRMYLGTADGFRQPPDPDQVARTGWSWGTTSLDFDNDSDRDLFVGNGHISGKSSQDYCSVFWRHDIYTGNSQANPVLGKLFLDVQQEFEKQKGGSWNGFEHNCLLVQDDGRYINLSYLMGVASEFDTRAVVSNDIDSDGRLDLLVVENSRGRPAVLHVMRNNLASANHWIGIRLVDEAGHSPLGAKITLVTESGRSVAHIVAGDSFTSQHPAAAHFGLGSLTAVSHIEIRWQDGTVRRLESPAVDRYHLVRAGNPSDVERKTGN